MTHCQFLNNIGASQVNYSGGIQIHTVRQGELPTVRGVTFKLREFDDRYMELASVLEGFSRRDWKTDPSGTLRFAIVGAGDWARTQALPGIQSAPHCALSVIVTGDKSQAQQHINGSEQYEFIDYQEYENGKATELYDAVYVSTPNGTHLEHVRTAAVHDKAVLCEKPLEATVDRAEELVNVCSQQDVPLMVAYRMHTNPSVRRARAFLQEGIIGTPVQIVGNFTVDLLDTFPNPDQWRLNPDLVGPGTTLTDIGVYLINTTRFLLDASPSKVTAWGKSPNEAFDDLPDERTSFMIEFDDGVQGSFIASQNAYADSQLKIIGTEGSLNFEPAFQMETDLTVERGGASAAFDSEWVNEMAEEFAYFADHVLSGTTLYADGEHGLMDMYVVDALYEAIESGDPVLVDSRKQA